MEIGSTPPPSSPKVKVLRGPFALGELFIFRSLLKMFFKEEGEGPRFSNRIRGQRKMQEGNKKENSCCYYDRFGLRSVCERHRFALAWVARYVIWTALICTKKVVIKTGNFTLDTWIRMNRMRRY